MKLFLYNIFFKLTQKFCIHDCPLTWEEEDNSKSFFCGACGKALSGKEYIQLWENK